MSILYPRDWTSQPQTPVPINTGHPLARGITFAMLGHTPDYNCATRNRHTVTTTGSVSILNGSHGGSLYTPQGAWADLDIQQSWFGASSVTIACVLRSVDSPWGGLFAKHVSGTTVQLGVGRNNATNSYYIATADSTIALYTNSISSTVGVFTVLTFVMPSPTSDCYLYTNGRFKNTSGTLLGGHAPGTGVLGLGRERTSSASYDSDVEWLLFIRHNRVLTDSEAYRLGSNPWQVFSNSGA